MTAHDKWKKLIDLTGICRNVQSQELSPSPDLFALARVKSHEPGCVFLASGAEVDSARYHILGLHPWFVLQAKNHTWVCKRGNTEISASGSPLDAVRSILQANAVSEQNGCGPAQAGLFGYLGYELSRHIESLPCTSLDTTGLPDMYLAAPSIVLTQEVHSGRTWLHLPIWDHDEAPGVHERQKLCALWTHDTQQPRAENHACQAPMPSSSLSRDQYLRAVETILEYIRSGHVYQVNLSQRLVQPFQGDPFDLFSDLFARNPAPFYAYIQTGGHQVISTSPERFLTVHNGRVETRPIKGTRPRGKDADQDQALAKELQESPKDGAELAMIVDLMRNDLGRVCAPGSVQVCEHKRLEAYDNVFHLVSIVQGRLEPEYDLVDLIQATFPGGSITGCPKIRAMEIIDELEPFQRHVYTGSIGYLGFNGRLDLSIAIRTAVVSQGCLVYSVGGGVVMDSDPEQEYQETWHKGRTFAQVLTASPGPKAKQAWVWYNGHLVMESEAWCSIRSPAVEYGFGAFETLRADRGRIWFEPEHIHRMNTTWQSLTGRALPHLDWDKIATRVLKANGFYGPAVVKIYAGQGVSEDIFCISARDYTHRLSGQNRDNLDLLTHPEPRQSFLAGMKTANHLIYILAGKWARNQGGDEALIINPDRTVSETNSANLILVHDSQAVVPISPHVLPGVMQAKAISALTGLGFSIRQGRVQVEELFNAQAVLMTNSLLGVIGVRSLDGHNLNLREDLIRRLNELIFGFQPLTSPIPVR